MRELRPALTPEEMREAESVFRHAIRSDIKLAPRAHARAVIRCNQLASDNRKACDWISTLEALGSEIQARAKARLFAHLTQAHPYLTLDQRRSLVGQTYFSLRDIGG